MGKTCHLPGTRNHLVGDRERLGRGGELTPKEEVGFVVERPLSYHGPEWESENSDFPGYSRFIEFLEVIEKDEKNRQLGRVLTAEEIVWRPLDSELGTSVVDLHFDQFTNRTARNRRNNTKKSVKIMRSHHQQQTFGEIQDYEQIDELSSWSSVELVFEPDIYRIGKRMLGVRINLADAENEKIINDETSRINTMLDQGFGKISVQQDALNLYIPIFEANRELTHRNFDSFEAPDVTSSGILFGSLSVRLVV